MLRGSQEIAFHFLFGSTLLSIRQLTAFGNNSIHYTIVGEACARTATVLPAMSEKSVLWVPLLLRVERETASNVGVLTLPLASYTAK